MFGLQISGGLGRTSKIIEIKISSLQVFSYQQLLHARFFSNVSISSCACPNLRNHNCLHKNRPLELWREFILSLVFFTVYVLCGFPFRQPGKQTNKLSSQIKQVFSLRVPALHQDIFKVKRLVYKRKPKNNTEFLALLMWCFTITKDCIGSLHPPILPPPRATLPRSEEGAVAVPPWPRSSEQTQRAGPRLAWGPPGMSLVSGM